MGNFRNKVKERFSQIPNELLYDTTLSDRARFVYCWMAGKPDDWDFYISHMAEELGYSKDTLRKYIKELITAKWLTKGPQTVKEGRFGAVQYTLEDSVQVPSFSDTEKFRHVKTTRHNNTEVRNNTEYYSKKELNKFNSKKSESSKESLFEEIPKKKQKQFPPTLEEVTEYCQERKNMVDPESFIDFYTSKGWVIGKSKMKCWKAAVRTWEKNTAPPSHLKNKPAAPSNMIGGNTPKSRRIVPKVRKINVRE